MNRHSLQSALEEAPFYGNEVKLFKDSQAGGHSLCILAAGESNPTSGYRPGAFLLDGDGTIKYNSGTVSSCTWSAPSSGAPDPATDFDLNDDVFIRWGSSQDVTAEWDTAGTPDAFIWSAAADDTVMQFGNGTNDFDLLWYMGDAAKYVKFDASAAQVHLTGTSFRLDDDDYIYLGTGLDGRLWYNAAANALNIDVTGTPGIVKFGSAVSTVQLLWTVASTGTVTFDDTVGSEMVAFNGVDLRIKDDDLVEFGDDGDLLMAWDGTNFVIQPKTTDTGVFTIGNSTAPGYYCDTQIYMGASTSYWLFDNNAQLTYIEGTDVRFGDDDLCEFGDGGAATFMWETADPNANCLLLELPAGGGVDVPVFAIGIGIENVDLALFNGLTQTTLAVLDADHDSYFKIDWSADDVARIAVGGTATTIGIASNTTFGDGVELGFGGVVTMFYEVADDNANCLMLELPAGDATDVPVFCIGSGLDGQDLAIFNGITQPTVALVDDDRDTALLLDFSGDDAPRIRLLGAGGAAGVSCATNLLMGDGNELSFGGVTTIFYEVADPNANCTMIELPAGDATDVPVLCIGSGLDGQDLGIFDGITQPTLALVDDDRDTALVFDFSGDDAPRLRLLGAGGATGIACATNLTFTDGLEVSFGGVATIFWDASDDNANALFIEVPATDGTDIPGVVIGSGIDGQDLGLLDGFTNTGLHIVDADRDSHLSFYFSADDTAAIKAAGSGTSIAFASSITLADSIAATFGTGSDAKLQWNGTYFELGPASGMWAGCPHPGYPALSTYIHWQEHFVTVPCDDTTGDPTGWFTYLDAGGSFTLPAGQGAGGIALLSSNAANNNEYTIQLGGAHSDQQNAEMFVITDSSTKKLWFECRVKSAETQDGMVLIGLAQGGAAAGGDVLVDDTGTLKDIDILCWRYKQDAPTEWDVAWRKNGQAEQENANQATNAGAFHVFGWYFDGASTVTPYADGTAKTTIDTSAATFPSGEEMSPIISVKSSAAGGVAQTMYVDYVIGVQML